MSKRNLIAHYVGGNSDKVYMACIRDNADGTFTVIGKYGRRGTVKQQSVKASQVSLVGAEVAQKRLFLEKLSEGYKDIDDPNYTGPVNRATECVADNLEPEITPKAPRTPRANPIPEHDPVMMPTLPEPVAPKVEVVLEDDGVVVCVQNIGMEDKFDLETEYVAEMHKDNAMIWVYDKFGKRAEYFKERFPSVSEYNRRKAGGMKFYQPKPGETLTINFLKKRGERA